MDNKERTDAITSHISTLCPGRGFYGEFGHKIEEKGPKETCNGILRKKKESRFSVSNDSTCDCGTTATH